MWMSAADARDRAISTGQWSFDTIVAIVLAAAAAEAFVNEVPPLLQMNADTLKTNSQHRTLNDILSEIEDQRGSVLLKFLNIGYILGRPYDRGANPFQDFATLVSLRNEAMHAKQRDKLVQSESGAYQVEWPKQIKALQQRGLTQDFPGMSGFDALQTPKMAAWACDVAAAMLMSVLELFPDGRSDPLQALKWGWRKYSERSVKL